MEPFVYYMVCVDGSESAKKESRKGGIAFLTNEAAIIRAREILRKPGITWVEVDQVNLTKAGVEEFIKEGLILSN